jgi:uncharacterized surface protein with fasciclin (FAS1) repeats
MQLPRLAVAVAATAVLALATPLAAQAAPSQPAAPAALKNQPLSEVLAPFGDSWNKKWNDYNVVAHAVGAVLEAKPDSDVAVLADGKVKLTAFVPTDRAFQRLVADLTGDRLKKERKVYKAALTLGVDTIEQVLLYHVVPGKPLTAKKALKADGASLTTAQGESIKVNVKRGPVIKLIDRAPAIANPRVILSQTDINKGNKQIAHGINRVLLPVPLEPAA